ncbi:hypothetical protein L2E82_29748 [Cichorium intybus]|uniref:Uncharacterized protein n=1 Tax=Cichorium intybus TaxID=13427 RepID=A0ACB9CYM1_CICIN|nr:hypothetical protein L2E82_29748 [Cichorium intybus]
MDRWSKALTEVANLKGNDVNGRLETEFIEEIVKDIYRRKSSYMEDISRRCNGKYNGLLDIQKQLCSDISKASSIEVYRVSEYTSKIENVVARKRVFLVLDDIDSSDQLDALLGSKVIHNALRRGKSWMDRA